MNKKTLTTLMIIILIVLVGLWYFRFYNPQSDVVDNANSNTNEPQGIDTSGWVEYKNNVYNFSLKHPEDFKIVVYAGDPNEATSMRLCYNEGCMWLYKAYRENLEIIDLQDSENFVYETWQMNKDDDRANKNVGDIKNSIIDGITLYYFDITESFLLGDTFTKLEEPTRILLFYNNYQAVISYDLEDEIFEQVINTLNFY